MNIYVALLRAVNVGGTGKLPMSTLVTLCKQAGFSKVRTYIASGNVVFSSDKTEAQVRQLLRAALEVYAGKPMDVAVRTAAEISAVLAANPFADRAANRTLAIFLDTEPPADALAHASGLGSEEMRLGKREIYVFYGEGMGTSKLKIPAAKTATARNMNTIEKLAQIAAELAVSSS